MLLVSRVGIFVVGAATGVSAALLATVMLRSPTDAVPLVATEAPAFAAVPQPENRQLQPVAVLPSPPVATDVIEPRMIDKPLPSGLEEQWEVLVSGALEHEVTHRLGRRLEPAAQQRLLDKLAQLRYASQSLQEPVDPNDSATLQAQLAHTFAILQVERAFRQELGIGVAEFIQGLDPEAVEDVAPPRKQP